VTLFLAAAALSGCQAPPLDAALHTGPVRLDQQVRQAVAVPPGSSARGLEAVAVASGCPGAVGGVDVGPTWTRVDALGEAPAVSDCGEPIWVEVRQERSGIAPDGLLIIVDTLRADHVTAEGTPTLWAHAQAGWWPEQTWAPSPWTQPSVAALFTGRPPWAIAPEGTQHLPAEQRTLAELLPGHQSWFVSTNPYTYGSRGFGQGFERVAELAEDPRAVDTLLSWIAEPRQGPRFVVVHLTGPHLPYEPKPAPAGATERVGDQFWDLDHAREYTDPADQARIRQLYAAEVTQVDGQVARLMAAMPDAVVAIVSDHGEELFEHGGFEHGHALWPEITRVHAAMSGSVERPGGLTRLQDVGPRLALALGAQDPGTWAAPSDAVLLGRMLPTRSEHMHERGVVAPEGILLLGRERFADGDVDALRTRLREFEQTTWIQERVDRRVCQVSVVAGETLRLSASAGWEVPPGAWGVARRQGGDVVVQATRSGSWAVSGVDGTDCVLENTLAPIPFSELETERLRALGYVE
jgi:hypothetical protein